MMTLGFCLAKLFDELLVSMGRMCFRFDSTRMSSLRDSLITGCVTGTKVPAYHLAFL
jgi:hypothetical protein